MSTLELFTYDFLSRAFLIGVLASIVAAILGNFLLASRQAVMSEMLAHTSLAGVGLGLLLGFSPSLSAALTAIASSVILYFLSQNRSLSREALSVLILTGGIAIALLTVSLSDQNTISLDTYLFGSILTTTSEEATLFIFLSCVLLLIIGIFYNRFLIVIFDPDFSHSRFPFTSFYQLLFMMMIGVFVALSLKVIGGLLVSGLLVIPVLTAQQFSRSFRISLLLSIFFGLTGVISGILLSFLFDVPTSSSIILGLIFLFLLSLLVQFLQKSFQ